MTCSSSGMMSLIVSIFWSVISTRALSYSTIIFSCARPRGPQGRNPSAASGAQRGLSARRVSNLAASLTRPLPSACTAIKGLEPSYTA